MDWTAIGIGLAWVLWTAYQYFFQEKDKDHTKLDITRSEIISAYETRIKQLEAQHTENESRITALEETVRKQTKIMQKQKEYIESLVELVTGRDPEIQVLLENSRVAFEKFTKDTAPKVDEIHKKIL